MSMKAHWPADDASALPCACGPTGVLLNGRCHAARSRLHLGNRALDRLEGFLGEVGIKLADLARLGDKAFISDLGIFRLDLNRVVERLGADKLLEVGRARLERALGIIRGFRSDRLEALREGGRDRAHSFKLLFAEFLEIIKIRRHSLLL